MYCPNCGTKLNDKALNFCPNCGSQISKTVESHSQIYTTAQVPAMQKISGRPGPHSNKCLGFAIASLAIGIASVAFGLILIIFLRIIGSIILLIIHIVGLSLGNSAKNHCKKAAELEPSNSVEKAGSVIVIFGIIINTVLLIIDIILTIIFFIIFAI